MGRTIRKVMWGVGGGGWGVGGGGWGKKNKKN